MEWLERLRYLKDTTDETYKSISEKTQIPQTTIEKLFSGRTKDPKLNMMKDIVHCLGYTLDDLLQEKSENNKSLSYAEKMIISNYNKLNHTGQKKADDYICDLLANPKYTEQDKINYSSETDIIEFKAAHTSSDVDIKQDIIIDP